MSKMLSRPGFSLKRLSVNSEAVRPIDTLVWNDGTHLACTQIINLIQMDLAFLLYPHLPESEAIDEWANSAEASPRFRRGMDAGASLEEIVDDIFTKEELRADKKPEALRIVDEYRSLAKMILLEKGPPRDTR